MTGRADSHIHLFEHGFGGDLAPGQELAQYESLRERHAISHSLVVGYEGNAAFAGNNDYVLGLGESRDWLHPLVYLDPQRPLSSAEALAKLDAGAAGFSLYLAGNDHGAFGPDFWASVAGHGNVILSVNGTAAACSDLLAGGLLSRDIRVLVSHLASPGVALAGAGLTRYRAAIATLAATPNVGLKLSGLYDADPVYPHNSIAPLALEALDRFGPERMLWGSDFAPGLSTVTADELFGVPGWLAEQLTPSELSLVLHANLEHLVGAA
ncbi:amidohydrolase family protein [Lysinibacter cavernae]|uniref:Putative TIM-barrel fold metal-dependent hydrolase n=1 Tax=Lysinibacter cavernae TaxID=1640652 RepID=A0A7X5R334_9MICO|nr:putative TIM-barrel fold metal-dependent hydrolase [Lysinibacter cavernae]